MEYGVYESYLVFVNEVLIFIRWNMKYMRMFFFPQNESDFILYGKVQCLLPYNVSYTLEIKILVYGVAPSISSVSFNK